MALNASARIGASDVILDSAIWRCSCRAARPPVPVNSMRTAAVAVCRQLVYCKHLAAAARHGRRRDHGFARLGCLEVATHSRWNSHHRAKPTDPMRDGLPRLAERWQSGRLHRTRNAAYSQGYREFESPPLRQRIVSRHPRSYREILNRSRIQPLVCRQLCRHASRCITASCSNWGMDWGTKWPVPTPRRS